MATRKDSKKSSQSKSKINDQAKDQTRDQTRGSSGQFNGNDGSIDERTNAEDRSDYGENFGVNNEGARESDIEVGLNHETSVGGSAAGGNVGSGGVSTTDVGGRPLSEDRFEDLEVNTSTDSIVRDNSDRRER